MLGNFIPLQFRKIAKLFNDGYRCRFDPLTLQQMPLGADEEACPKEICSQCTWNGRSDDEFCVEYQKVWEALCDYDESRYGPESDPERAT
jgi:hypothetical protein